MITPNVMAMRILVIDIILQCCDGTSDFEKDSEVTHMSNNHDTSDTFLTIQTDNYFFSMSLLYTTTITTKNNFRDVVANTT